MRETAIDPLSQEKQGHFQFILTVTYVMSQLKLSL
jgi:hypothetical protein